MIALNQVHKSIATRPVLRGLDLSLGAGSIYGLLGRNGAGKTTTIRLLLGLLTPDSGSIEVANIPVTRNPQLARRNIGALLEHDGLYSRLSCLANMRFFASAYGVAKSQAEPRIAALLRQFGIFDRRHERVGSWSRGMRHKCAIARALIHQPQVLLLDEPFASLDPETAGDLRRELRLLARQSGTTILIASHDLNHVERCCDSIGFLKNGAILSGGAPSEVARTLIGSTFLVTEEARSDSDWGKLVESGRIHCFLRRPSGVELSCSAAIAEVLASDAQGGRWREVEPSLEHAFLVVMRGGDSA